MLKNKTNIAIVLYFGLFRLYVLFAGGLNDSRNSNSDQLAHAAVKAFCASEYAGDEFENRKQLVTLSSNYKDARKHITPLDPKVFDPTFDKLVIVKDFKINSVFTSGNSGKAKVSYFQVAHSEGKGIISIDQEKIIEENLNLVFNGGRWKIIDPPSTKVSIKAILDAYEEEDRLYDEKWIQNASVTQLKTFQVHTQTLAQLLLLRDKYLINK